MIYRWPLQLHTPVPPGGTVDVIAGMTSEPQLQDIYLDDELLPSDQYEAVVDLPGQRIIVTNNTGSEWPFCAMLKVAGNMPTALELTFFDHENRLRTIEGQPPLTMDEFLTSLSA